MSGIFATLFQIHIRRLWSQRLRTGLAMLAVAAGTSLVLGVIIVVSSLDTSLTSFGANVGGPAPLRIVGATASGGLAPSVPVIAAATPGVAHAIPVVQATSIVRTRTGADTPVVVVGASCDAGTLVGLGACGGQAHLGNQTLIGGTLARTLGPGSWLQTDQGVVPLAGDTVAPRLDTVAGGDIVVMDLARAQTLFDRGNRYDVVYIELARRAHLGSVQRELARSVGPAYGVLRTNQPPPAVALATDTFVPLLALVAVLAAGIAAVLVYDVVALSLEERRHQQAVVAAIGAPPWLLVAGPAVEAAVTGAIGGLAGAAGGIAIARPVLAPISVFTSSLLGAPASVHVTVADVALGLVFGTAIGLLAVTRPVQRMARLDIAAELSGRDRRQHTAPARTVRRLTVLILVVVAGVVMAFAGTRHGALAPWQEPVALAGFLVVTVAGILAVGTGAMLPITAAVCWRSRYRRSTARPATRTEPEWLAAIRLGLVGASREPGRVAIMVVAVAAAVGVGTITAGYTQGMAAATRAQVAHATQDHGIVVETAGGATGDSSDARIPVSVVSEIAALPDVAGVDLSASVLSGSSPSALVFVSGAASPAGGPTLVEGSTAAGPFRRGAVLVGAGLARRDNLRAGSRVRLDTPDGVTALPVEGVWDEGAVDGDTVTMAGTELDRLFGLQLPTEMTVLPTATTTDAGLLRQLRSLPLPPDITLTPPARYAAEQVALQTNQLAPFWALERALLVVAFLGVLATLLLLAVQRRREIGLLGAIGMTPGSTFAMTVAEAGTVGLVGAASGVGVGAGVLAVMLEVAPLLVGFHDPFRFDSSVLLTTAPVALAVVLAAAVLPAARAARLIPVDALRQD